MKTQTICGAVYSLSRNRVMTDMQILIGLNIQQSKEKSIM